MSFLKRYSLFRTPRRVPVTPTAQEPAPSSHTHSGSNTVIETKDMESGFTAIAVRPMTYAEAARSLKPTKGTRVSAATPYNPIDEAKWAINEVDHYLEESRAAAAVRPSSHVVTNLELMDYEGRVRHPRDRKKRTRRHR